MFLTKLKTWTDLSQWFALDRLALASAVRTVAAALIPLIIARTLGLADFAGIMALAGLYISRTDPGGPYRAKALAMGCAALGVAISAFVAATFSQAGWWTVPLMFAWTFGCTFAAGFGSTISLVCFAFMQIFVVTIGFPGSLAIAPERFLACLVGGAWTIVLSIWLWPLRPYLPVKLSVAAYFQAVSDYLVEIGRASTETDRATALAPKRAAANKASLTATDFVVKSRAARQGASEQNRNLVALAANAGELLDMAVRLAEELDIAAGNDTYRLALPEIRGAISELAAATGHLAEIIRQEWGELHFDHLDGAIAAFDARVTELRLNSPNLEAEYTSILYLRNNVNALESMTDVLRTAAETARDLEEITGGNLEGFNPRQYDRPTLGDIWNVLRDNLTFNSLIFRHALRTALVLALAVALYLGFQLNHGYWITLTILVIIKPDFGGTLKLSYRRVIGTIFGGVVGAVLAATIHFDLVIYLLMAVLGVLAYAILPRNYGVFVALLTAFVILLIDLSQPGDWEVAGLRILLTAIGAVMALGVSYLFLPGWQRRFLPEQLARTIAANRAYFRAVMGVYLGENTGPTRLLKTREQAHIETANAETAFQLLISEPKRQQANVSSFYALVIYNRRLVDSVTAIAAHLPEFSGQHQLAGLAEYTNRIDSTLGKLEDVVRRGEHPGQPPALDESWQAIQAALRKLSSRRVSELKAAQGRPATTTVQAIYDFAAVSRLLERVAQDVAMMYREQNQVSRG
jgi:uncharacterized membrane protein YccC